MASFNKVILMGNLTRDPELRYTSKGTAIAKIGLAVNRVWRTETGEQKEEVTFVDVDAFGKQAETIGQYLKKGRPVLVEGRLKLDTWDDKQSGQKKSKLGVVLETFQFLGSGQGHGQQGQQQGREGAPSEPAARPRVTENNPAPAEEMPSEDDVPF
jgi:single-strand DNA-binding protein